jgi:hypothetical protein
MKWHFASWTVFGLAAAVLLPPSVVKYAPLKAVANIFYCAAEYYAVLKAKNRRRKSIAIMAIQKLGIVDEDWIESIS